MVDSCQQQGVDLSQGQWCKGLRYEGLSNCARITKMRGSGTLNGGKTCIGVVSGEEGMWEILSRYRIWLLGPRSGWHSHTIHGVFILSTYTPSTVNNPIKSALPVTDMAEIHQRSCSM